MAVILKEPRRKGHSNKRAGNPLPILVESETGIPAHLAIWRSFTGRFNGDCVEINDTEDISTLYTMGYFGKGLVSRGCPRTARKTNNLEVIRERQWKRRCTWFEEEREASCNEQHPASTSQSQSSNVIVIADTDTEGDDFIAHLQPRIEIDKGSFPETLNLLLEEAMFLSYGLGCLYIFDTNGERILNYSEFWEKCLESNSNFIQRYVCYHHFRSKGWVVKSGLKFGGDFLLYKDGPGLYHASYIVLSRVIFGTNAVDTGMLNEKKLDWITLMGLNRLAETSGKEVLLTYVIWPAGVLPGQTPSPNIVKKFKVHEVLIRRWQPSVARIDSKNPQVKSEAEGMNS